MAKTQTVSAQKADEQLRLEALKLAMTSPDWVLAPNGVLGVAASYYSFLKGNTSTGAPASNAKS